MKFDMFNVIYVLVMTVLVLFICWVVYLMVETAINSGKRDAENEKYLEEQNIISQSYLTHLGGHPYFQANDTITFSIKSTNSITLRKLLPDCPLYEIPMSDLIRYDVKSERDIQKDVTVVRLLALGIFAFAVKKKTEIEVEYLVLSYLQNGVEVNCLFKCLRPTERIGDIVSTMNRVKIENAVTQ